MQKNIKRIKELIIVIYMRKNLQIIRISFLYIFEF